MSFVVSPGPEDSIEPTRVRLARYPGMRLKVMPTLAWDDELARDLAATGAVDIVDLKGQYDETVPVALPADPALYRRVLDAFPTAWIEDPALTSDTQQLLAGHHEQITWDTPIRSVGDIMRLPFKPRAVNMKPSRFGSLRALFDAYDHGSANRIALYGGGSLNSAQAARRFSCSRRSFIPRRQTMSHQRPTTNPSSKPVCRPVHSPPRHAATASTETRPIPPFTHLPQPTTSCDARALPPHDLDQTQQRDPSL